jgi:hypothetical protein
MLLKEGEIELKKTLEGDTDAGGTACATRSRSASFR